MGAAVAKLDYKGALPTVSLKDKYMVKRLVVKANSAA